MTEKEIKDQPEKIKLTVSDNEGNVIQYEIKKTVPLQKVLNNYCSGQNKNPKVLQMSINGRPVDLEGSAESLGLTDGTVIDIVSKQVGGK